MPYTILENIQTQQYKDGMPKSLTRQVANPSDLAEMHPDTGLPRIWVDSNHLASFSDACQRLLPSRGGSVSGSSHSFIWIVIRGTWTTYLQI
jgi:hypothetical protein